MAFRRLFGGEATAPLLIDLLNAVIAPAKAVTGVEYLAPESELAHPDDKETVADVKVRDQGGRQFQVEMQREAAWFLPKRMMYYGVRLHGRQLRGGDHFMTLRLTILVCFLDAV